MEADALTDGEFGAFTAENWRAITESDVKYEMLDELLSKGVQFLWSMC